MSPVAIREVRHLQDIVGRRKTPEEIQKIRNPLFRAIAIAFLEKRVEGNWYLVRDNPEVQDFDFAFLGFKGKPQLNLEGLWLKQCRKCGQAIPVLILRRTLHLRDPIPNRIEQYEEKTERLSSLFTLECGEEHFDGSLIAQDLMRGKLMEKTPMFKKRLFLTSSQPRKASLLLLTLKLGESGSGLTPKLAQGYLLFSIFSSAIG